MLFQNKPFTAAELQEEIQKLDDDAEIPLVINFITPPDDIGFDPDADSGDGDCIDHDTPNSHQLHAKTETIVIIIDEIEDIDFNEPEGRLLGSNNTQKKSRNSLRKDYGLVRQILSKEPQIYKIANRLCLQFICQKVTSLQNIPS